MTTKTITKICLLAALGLASVVFNACKGDESKPEENNPKLGVTNTPTTDVGVVINGVKWATRNVDAFGTFAATPESAGMFYQWNRPKAWTATNTVTDWDNTYPTGTTWEKANDPSPKGWRVPTKVEMDKLFDAERVSNGWTTQKGVNGRKFTDKSTRASIFLPAAGWHGTSGAFYDTGTNGDYWSSTKDGDDEWCAYHLYFDSGRAGVSGLFHRAGFSVRSVAE